MPIREKVHSIVEIAQQLTVLEEFIGLVLAEVDEKIDEPAVLVLIAR